jgi:spectinomycin phosphotransferase
MMRKESLLPDEKIIACLRDSYGLAVTAVEFLPLGYDSYAGVYRVMANDGQDYFLKVKKDAVYPPSVNVPRYLKQQGIEQVVAPLPTMNGALWGMVESFTLLLYPFIEGEVGMDAGLSDQQWIAYGAVLNKLHTTQLSPELSEQMRKETFVPCPKWRDLSQQLWTAAHKLNHDDPSRQALAAFWQAHEAEINRIADRAETLGQRLQQRPSTFVLCHSDIHTANLMVTADDRLFVVDWDQPILAPKERDLLFIIGTMIGGLVIGEREENLFFEGYGKTSVDTLALGYYRYEWALQDICEFGAQVFLRPDINDAGRQEAARLCMYLFEPRSTVELAHRLDTALAFSG